MSSKTTKRILGLTVAAAVTLAGCGGSGSGDSGFAESYGFLSLGISDGPIHSAEKVCVSFTDIELKPIDGDPILITFDEPEVINLLDFQGANAMPVLTQEKLPAGNYNWMRLGVDAARGSSGGADTGGETCDGVHSYIVMDGAEYNLYVPSGDQSGLKLHGGYTVPVNDQVSLTAEFDLGKSITAPPGQAPDVKLRPTIKLVNNNEVGTLTGQVADDLAEADGCAPSVYVFESGVTPNAIVDEEDDPDDPVATAAVAKQDQSDGSNQWHYTVGFLLAGDYNTAFTCDGETFVPEAGTEATIIAGDVTYVNFEAEAAP